MPGPGDREAGLSADELAQALRDLRWLLLSPPLLAPGHWAAPVQAFDAEERDLIGAWLDRLDADPQPLAAHLQGPRPAALGRRAERLLHFFLAHGPTHRLLAAHLPVRAADGRTLGEIDFLLEDRRGRRWHWELAVKFFLCTARSGTVTPRHYLGPNGRERFSDKLERLFHHQLALTPPPPWDRVAWQRAAFVRGWTFEAPQARVQAPWLADGHLRGTWLTPAQAATLAGPWLPLPRARWMSPAVAAVAPPPLTPEAPGPGAQLHARLAPDGALWQEVERCFVVPSGLIPP